MVVRFEILIVFVKLGFFDFCIFDFQLSNKHNKERGRKEGDRRKRERREEEKGRNSADLLAGLFTKGKEGAHWEDAEPGMENWRAFFMASWERLARLFLKEK